MRITRIAASLSLALTAAPLIAATPLTTGHPPVARTAEAGAASAVSPSLYRYLVRTGALRSTAKKFTLSVTIGGSYNVPANSYGYLYTTVTGGTAPYNYDWYRNGGGIYSGPYSGQNPYFQWIGTEYFNVTVTDANGQTASAPTFFVHVY